IGSNTFIGGGLFISLREIIIGSDVMFSWGCTVIDNDAHSLVSAERLQDVALWKSDLEAGQPGKNKDWSKVSCQSVSVSDKSWIGFNSIILKGVQLGEGCVVGAGSVVTASFESFTLIAGNPARIIRKTE
ncbi:MAG: acyltransferase, partial [Bacteroidota bacterium]